MIKIEDLKVGMKLKFGPASSIHYIVEYLGPDWLILRDKNNNPQFYNHAYFNIKDAIEVKPKHKIYYCLYRNLNGVLFSASSANNMEECRIGYPIAKGIVEVEEGQGI